MAVVVNFDASWHPRQREGLGELAEKFLLRRCFGKLSPQRFTGIGERMFYQILLLTALRHRDLDLVAAAR